MTAAGNLAPKPSSDNAALLDIYNQYPFAIERGKDVFVYGTDGREYLDFYGGHCVCSVGHSRPEVTKAIAAQAEKLMFYSNLAAVPIREQAAEKLISFANNGLTKVFFCNSGGEANENALKIAIKLTGRKKLVSFKGSFHGRTLLAIGATDHPDWHEYLGPWIGPIAQMRPNEMADLSLIDNETAAVILEPVQSIGGCTVFEHDYLKALRQACDKAGAMLIFDEVQTGIGRTGVPFVSGHSGTLPDMMTLAKGLANGFAIGSVVMKPEVGAGLKKGDIAATFGGGPLAMAALLATLDVIEKEKLVPHSSEIEAYVRKRFSIPQVEQVKGKGCLLGLIVKKEAKQVQRALFDKGIITGPNSNPNLVHLLPPLTIQTKHVDQLFDALQQIL
ncbi:MAG: aminotransferase class III-fold pyridoxal phosphate-dependent enzyme [Bdellovibrionota bacterium]